MNAPLNSDSQLYTASDGGAGAAPAGYSPSVPISVYRELATELKTTQTTLDALTQQNQQLLRQNKLMRHEIQRFVQAAEQLGHFAGVIPQEPPATPPDMIASGRLQESPSHPEFFAHQPAPTHTAPPPLADTMLEPSAPEPVSRPPQMPQDGAAARPTERPASPQSSAIVPRPKAKKRDRPKPAHNEPHQQRLFTEQPEVMRPITKVASRSELGNLWLATTILLLVVSAFGAGFLIMRPLLNR
jgi:hypothetical protein